MESRSHLEYVLTDYNTGKAAYLDAKRRDIFDLMRASSALPRVYPIPVTIDGLPHYDGGQSDAIPVQRAIDLGARFIVLVRTRSLDYVKPPRSRRSAKLMLPRAEGAHEGWLSLHERYNEAAALAAHPPADTTVLQFAPTRLRLGRLDRSGRRIIEAIEHGREVAHAVLDANADRIPNAYQTIRTSDTP
jgi:predicted patatin/cPLA2 family phospholipase